MFWENSSVLQSGYRCDTSEEKTFITRVIRPPTASKLARKQKLQTKKRRPNNESVNNLEHDIRIQKQPNTETMTLTSKSTIKKSQKLRHRVLCKQKNITLSMN